MKSSKEKSGNIEDKANKKIKSILIAVGSAVLSYLIFGAVTAVIKNPFFTRMTPVGALENFSLAITSLLVGFYIGLVYYGRAAKKDKVCNASATAGGVFGFLTFGCSICNKILVFLFGVTGVLTYFEPLRPSLGILSIGLLSFAIFKKAKGIAA